MLTVGHVGNFTEPKNHLFIVDVFNELQKKQPNSRLVLIGDGHLRLVIEAMVEDLGISDKIDFLGVRTDIPDLCKMLDVFIFPSFYEGLPVTLIEAQATDLKIFASDTITKEVQISDRLTFLSIKESPEIWAEKIIGSFPYKRADNSELIQKSGYDIKKNAMALQEFYLNQKNNQQ